MRVLEFDDVDAANEALRSQYTAMRLTPTDTGRNLRIEQRQVADVAIHRVTYGMSAELDVESLGTICIGRIDAGTIVYRHGSQTVPCSDGDVVLVGQPDVGWSATLARLSAECVFIAPEMFDAVARPRRTDHRVQLTSYRPVSPAAARNWVATCAFVGRYAGDDDGVVSPLVAAAAAQLLVTTALSTFANTAALDPTGQDRHDAHPEALRRAVAYIESHPDRPLTPADISAAAHVSIRAVQLAFRRHLDTTPLAYARRVRLDRAHAELHDADPATTTVATVAARWGFAAPARFATDYRSAYGESPSATLRG